MTGLWLAYRFDLTSGASIILVSGIAFLMILGIEKLRLSARKANGRHS
jgi:ABC-type Mn2+/Zn2+ transport system permease subunit